MHLAFLPPALEDIDSINFALGLHDFDPARHQPHPPGYPLYMALGMASRAVVGAFWPALDAQAADARALAWWSALAGALALLLSARLVRLVARLARAPGGEAAAGPVLLILAGAPLFWMSGLRPLSDMPGLAAALAAQVLLLRACLTSGTPGSGASNAGERWPVWPVAAGAFASGLALGVRSQVLWLVAPLLVAAIVCHRNHGWIRTVLVAAGASAAGVLFWAVPLVVAAGGPGAYLAALGAMAGEDFANVPMLWTQPSARRLAFALVETFVRPWGHPGLAGVMLALAGLGTAILLWSAWRAAAWLMLMFGPYLALHLLFQETATVRYALPLTVPIVVVAAWPLVHVAPRLAWTGAAAIGVAALLVVLPVTRAYGGAPLPAGQVVRAAIEGQARDGGVVAGHFEFGRALGVSGLPADRRLPSPEFRERSELVRYWEEGGAGPVWFVAAPARTDLIGIDPASRRSVLAPSWPFSREWFLGGMRPARARLVRIDSPPGWVAGEGWHLTREELILSERRGVPSATLHYRHRADPGVLLIGGEYVPPADGSAVVLGLAFDGRPFVSFAVPASAPRFFQRFELADGFLSGPGPLGTLTVDWLSPRERAAAPRVYLTHVDLQPAGRLSWVPSHGWHDREYDPATDREWRWTSERAEVRVSAPGTDVEIRIAAEAPLAALDGTPTVTVSAGDRLLYTIRPRGAFQATVRVPFHDLDAAGGLLAIATDRTFVPGAQAGGDTRRLGLQVFGLEVDTAGP